MNRFKRRWTLLTAGMLAWSVFGVLPADAQIYPNFRPSMPMISPIGPRDPGMHTQPGNISNIPMGGSTATGTSSDQTGRRTIKKIKQVNLQKNQKITLNVILDMESIIKQDQQQQTSPVSSRRSSIHNEK